MHLSASAHIFAKTLTDEMGFKPLAVSLERTQASAPSRTAQVTSDASEREGLDFLHIDSSI